VKTALYYRLRGLSAQERVSRSPDIAASYREAVVSALVDKTMRAVRQEGVATLAVAGGVAANSLLRRRLAEEGAKRGVHVVIPRLAYCTDNAAMIGAAASAAPRLDYPDYMDLDASASLPLGKWLPDRSGLC
jgi:N6-L-threonylcarbamoyladenine synthase